MSSRRGFSLPTFPEGHMYSSSLCIHSRAKLTSSNSATRMECQGSSSWLLWTLSQLLPVHSAALLSKQGQRASCRLQTKYMFRAFPPLLKLALPFFCSSLDMTHVRLKPLQLFTLFLALSPSLQISHGSFSEFIQMFCSKVTFSD